MRDLSESTLLGQRIYALTHPEDVVATLRCEEHRADAVFWLAVMGWTEEAFLEELWMTGWRG
jgi:hypothetical protein